MEAGISSTGRQFPAKSAKTSAPAGLPVPSAGADLLESTGRDVENFRQTYKRMVSATLTRGPFFFRPVPPGQRHGHPKRGFRA